MTHLLLQNIILFTPKSGKEEKEVKDMKDWAAVQQVYKQTHSKRATARILGIARNTVRALLEMDHKPVYKRSVYPSKIDPFKDQIIEWRCAPFNFNGTRIYNELINRGYEGSIGPVYTFLKRIDEDIGGISSSDIDPGDFFCAFDESVGVDFAKDGLAFFIDEDIHTAIV